MASSKAIAGIAGLIALVVLVGGIVLYSGMNNSQNSAARSQEAPTMDKQPMDKQQKTTIVDAAAANENFSTLVTAIKAAELEAALSGNNKLTVFAPTNVAFDKLPAGTVESLVKPENKEMLQGILTYHVVEGEVLSSQLQNGQKVKTLNGAELTVTLEGDSVSLTDAKGGRAMVTQADMQVDNGVIHAIDTVVMPS